MPPQDIQDQNVGKILAGRYEVKSVIGAGGWSLVYQVRHTGLNKILALKVLHSHLVNSEENVTRFRREAEAVGRINHQAIAQVFDFGMLEDGRPYMAMEYLKGDTLSALIEREGPMNWKRALPLFTETAEGLAYAHRKGFIHRDLKPSNLFLVRDADGSEHIKILDFGLAKVVYGDQKMGESLTATGASLGTPIYMSPEQCKGAPLDRRSDIYSLGFSMYEILQGAKPFNCTGLYEIMQAHMSTTPPPFKGVEVPARLESIIMKCLAKSPDDRFAAADDIETALYAMAKGDDKMALKHKKSGRRLEYEYIGFQDRLSRVATFAGVIVLCFALAGGLFLLKKQREEKKALAAIAQNTPAPPELTVPPPAQNIVLEKSDEDAKELAELKGQVAQLKAELKKKNDKQPCPPPAKAEPQAPSAVPAQALATAITQPSTALPQNTNTVQVGPGGWKWISSVEQHRGPEVAARAAQRYWRRHGGWNDLPQELKEQINVEDNPQVIARHIGNWLRRNQTYNYAVYNEMRNFYWDTDRYLALYYTDEILRHNIADEFQLECLAEFKTQADPGGAMHALISTASNYPKYKYARAGCLLKVAMMQFALGDRAHASETLKQIAENRDPDLQPYRNIAVNFHQTK